LSEALGSFWHRAGANASTDLLEEPAITVQQLRKIVHPAWSEIEDGVTWASAGTQGSGRIRLMTEQMPDGSWTWTAWRAIRPGEFQSGSVLTQDAACAAAEGAAAGMANHDRVSHLR
jgi:hypothetical protein